MVISKMSAKLSLALRYETLLSEEAKSHFILPDGRWELIVAVGGDTTDIENNTAFEITKISKIYLSIRLEKEQIETLNNYDSVTFISLPSVMSYIASGLPDICASNIGNVNSSFNVRGEGVLLGVVDSGLDLTLPDFRNADGSSRVVFLWDQTQEGNPPEGFARGTEYTKADIDAALNAGSTSLSQDSLGHGTKITGIAAGNGRGTGGVSSLGVAPNCDLIIVKVGKTGSDGSKPRDLDIMEGIAYVVGKAEALRQPISVLMGVGDNLTGHDGLSSLENLIDELSYAWQCNFVVGSGNQGDKGTHTAGVLAQGKSELVQLLVQGDMQSYGVCIWKQFIDEVELVIRSPQGEVTEVLSPFTSNRAYLFDNTAVLVSFTEPTLDIVRQEIFIWFQAQPGSNINEGIWSFTLSGKQILEGNYDIWSQIKENESNFLDSDVTGSITSPATSIKVTAVGAFNGNTNQIAPFSGRGLTRDNRIKPDLAATGVNITTVLSSAEGESNLLSGTSVASAFVAGAYVLMLQYGLITLGNPNFYGERLKIYLLRTARRISNYGPYPNTSWGYGGLCIEAALNELLEINSSSN